ncbi:membrane protease subunit HflK [Massilia sp. PDC64]|nr:FtsH protease activity modulator HflK [Massilia sp. PDC64]SDE35338.1 membrane protease subunit HflK [Massilia sp. PDC64]
MLVSLIKRIGARLAPTGRHAGARKAGVPIFSLNDPRWGHNPKSNEGRRPNNNNKNDSDGPPDLDQLWRDFNQRLNRLFGGKRGGDGGPFRPDARGIGLTATVVGAIALLIWLASGAFIVQEGQVGIVTTFGRLSHVTGAGFNWRWPAPFQSHETVNTAQVQTAEIGYRANVRNKQPSEALMLTGDENIVDVQFSVQYKIKDPVAWVFNNRDQVETIRDSAETVVRELVGQNKMDTVLYTGRDKLAAEAREAIQRLADRYRMGAEIVGVTMQSVQPPDQVVAAFEDAGKAQEERARARSEAQAFADEVIPQAKGKAARLLQDAEAYRASVVSVATGNAARFDKIVAEYAKAPAVTRDRMYIETMQQILSSTSKVMIDAKTGTNQIYLPLDRLLAQSTANEAARGANSGPMMAPSTNPAQPAQQQQAQPQPQQQPAPAQSQPQPEASSGESNRTRDLRSRDTGRERESR